jgi:putative tryptophan/tyrosine transport system substrate-binding protein
MKKVSFTLFILAALIFAPVNLAQAQKPTSIPRIGVLHAGTPPDISAGIFIEGLRQLGYNDGKNISIEHRFAQGKTDRLPELAKELVQLKVDAIFGGGAPAALALKQATKTIPIVFVTTTDPIGIGIVASLAHPSGNVTGITLQASDLWPKRLELLKEVSPKVSTVAMLWNKGYGGMALEARATKEVAGPLGVVLLDQGLNDANELESALALMAKDRPDAFLALMDPVLTGYRKRILEFLEKNRLPAIFQSGDWVEAGGLMSYGPRLDDGWRRAASLMDKILKGVKPADIPVEQPTKFELVINLKTAKQMGLTIPDSVLFQADRVIK